MLQGREGTILFRVAKQGSGQDMREVGGGWGGMNGSASVLLLDF